MNKLILVLFLAVCLISVHGAIVKRETETSSASTFDITKEFGDFQKKIEETFSPQKIQETLGKVGDSIKEGINKLIPTEAPKA